MTPRRAYLAGLLTTVTVAIIIYGDPFLLVIWTASVITASALGFSIGRAAQADDRHHWDHLAHRAPRSIP
jgi:hypothetical protein